MEKLGANHSGAQIQAEIEAEGAQGLAQCVSGSGVVSIRKDGAAMYVGVYVRTDFVRLELGHDKRELACRRHDAEDDALEGLQLKPGEVPEIGTRNEEGASEALVAKGML